MHVMNSIITEAYVGNNWDTMEDKAFMSTLEGRTQGKLCRQSNVILRL